MLIYHQRGTAEPDQAAFVARALEWQKGNFSHRFEAPSELATFVRTDLSNLIAENFRPAPSDEQFRIQLSMCLENLEYAVTSDCFVGGLRIPIFAEHRRLVLPQVLMIGWQPNHLDILRDAVLADRNRYSSAVYIVGEDLPERLPDLIRAVALENLLNLAGPGLAKAQLRRGASEWRALGSRRVMDWQQFERLSDFRRQIRLQLDESELAYALRCSIQHGKNLPFWCKANSANARAIDVVLGACPRIGSAK